MASLSAEKKLILGYIARALGNEGVLNVPVPVSFPPLEGEFRPDLMAIVESVELHLGIPHDRSHLTKGKPLTVDLHLPSRGLFVELDREGHDLQPQRATTLLYYPPGLPRGISLEHYRRLHIDAAAQSAPASGATWKMNAGRALTDFVKDLCVEGMLGKVLVSPAGPLLINAASTKPRNPDIVRVSRYYPPR